MVGCGGLDRAPSGSSKSPVQWTNVAFSGFSLVLAISTLSSSWIYDNSLRIGGVHGAMFQRALLLRVMVDINTAYPAL